MSKSDIAIKIRGQYRGQTKWTDIYTTEEALLADLGSR